MSDEEYEEISIDDVSVKLLRSTLHKNDIETLEDIKKFKGIKEENENLKAEVYYLKKLQLNKPIEKQNINIQVNGNLNYINNPIFYTYTQVEHSKKRIRLCEE